MYGGPPVGHNKRISAALPTENHLPLESPARTPFPFSLRTLFLFVTFLGIIAIPLTLHVSKALDATAVERHGLVWYDLSGNVGYVFLAGNPSLSDQDLARIVPYLAKQPALTRVVIHSDRVTDKGLALLCKLRTLEELDILDTSLTDAGVASLNSLPGLRRVSIRRSMLTDASLQSLARLQALEAIQLSSPNITDRGLIHLAKVPSLKELALIDTNTTESALKKLDEQLPEPLVPYGSLRREKRLYSRVIGS